MQVFYFDQALNASNISLSKILPMGKRLKARIPSEPSFPNRSHKSLMIIEHRAAE
jgi:hypothetical protein